jgi:arsenite methyltransferase
MNSEVSPAEQDIRSAVRQRYGEVARARDSRCCGPSESSSCGSSSGNVGEATRLYDKADLAMLPPEVVDLSMGCGDPVALASLEPGQTVLDLGSGGGIDCFLAGQRVGPTGHVIGVDMTADLIERARANARKIGASNVEFRLGEIEHLPAADSSVDVIISNCVINLSPDKPQVFCEAYRVLKPGGQLAVSDIVTYGKLPQAVLQSLEAWAGCIAGALEESDYIKAIEEAGFVDAQVTSRDYYDVEAIAEFAEFKCCVDQVDLAALKKQLDKRIASIRIIARKPA